MRTRIILGMTLGVLLIVFIFSQFYQAIQSNHWHSDQLAALRALKQVPLKEVNYVDDYAGENDYQIVFGKDLYGNQVIVWVRSDSLHTEAVGKGITFAQVKKKVLDLHPNAQLMRIVPGKLNDNYIWEVLYKIKEDGGGSRLYYDYYRFTDGFALSTLKLSKQ